jgi:hypothetical protein
MAVRPYEYHFYFGFKVALMDMNIHLFMVTQSYREMAGLDSVYNFKLKLGVYQNIASVMTHVESALRDPTRSRTTTLHVTSARLIN